VCCYQVVAVSRVGNGFLCGATVVSPGDNAA
jgi:hypothetical protein